MDNPSRAISSRPLPDRPELQRLCKEAKLLLKNLRASDDQAAVLVNTHYRNLDIETFQLSDAQLVVARSYGFCSWPKLAAHVQSLEPQAEGDPLHYKAIFQAVKSHDAATVLALLDGDESGLDIADNNKSTPLTVAFAYGRLELARLLIERGANVFAMNHSDQWGMRYMARKTGCLLKTANG